MSDAPPVIGICTELVDARWGIWEQRAALLAELYIVSVQDAGGLVLMIPPDPRLEQDPDAVLDRIDGLVLAGGADVDPDAYGATPHPRTIGTVPERDRAELALARRAAERNMPVLGICRGMQVLNVAFGGTLNQHVPDEVGHEQHRRHPGTFEDNDHDVQLDPGSLAAQAAGEERHSVKSHHHQGVDRLGDQLHVTGVSVIDQLPEAIEAPGRRFCLGVQWHPEADETSRVVAALVDEARDYRTSRGSA
jgi:putative glutamine amidotransferase